MRSGSSCCTVCRCFLHIAMKTTSDKRATAELLAALVEVAIAHGRRHYSESGEPLATRLRCSSACSGRASSPSRRRKPKPCPVGARARTIRSVPARVQFGLCKATSAGSPLAPGPQAFLGDLRLLLEGDPAPTPRRSRRRLGTLTIRGGRTLHRVSLAPASYVLPKPNSRKRPC